VTAVRGRVLPVADLRRLVGVPEAGEDAAQGSGWHVVVDDGRRAAALAGLRLRRVAPCAFAEQEAPGAGEWGGGRLPVRGVARLEGDAARGAEALPPEAALLDVAALLDLVHDPRTDGD
jgi:chemotaxis signal transduction protein